MELLEEDLLSKAILRRSVSLEIMIILLKSTEAFGYIDSDIVHRTKPTLRRCTHPKLLAFVQTLQTHLRW